MAAVTFDTLKFVETLKEAGVSETQAKAFSTAVQESHEAADLATKTDLREYESAIRGDLEKLDIGLRHEMGNLETGLRHEMKELETGLRHEISDLRKDMDTRFASLDGRFAGIDAKLEKLELRMTIKLGSIVVVALGAFTVIFKFL